MECYTGLKWVKREYPLPQILSLVCQNVFKEVLLTGPKILAKIHIGKQLEIIALLWRNTVWYYELFNQTSKWKVYNNYI